jgi:DNA polymerase-3 subunit delta'
MRFRDIAGQNHAVGLLTKAMATGRLAHAYLFDGPDGVGKRSAAIGLALAIACQTDPGQGCGVCDTCRRMLTGQHPDLRVLAPESATYLVEQAREAVSWACTRPHEAPGRVIVLDRADALNPASANCLLKTLEEPFPGNYIVLISSSPDRLLPTIRSRVERVRFVSLKPETLLELALRRGVDRVHAETAAVLAGGQVSRLYALCEKEAESDLWVQVGRLRSAAGASDMGSIFDVAASYAEKESRENLPEVLDLLARFYRDALTIAVDAKELVLLRDRASELEILANRACQEGSPTLLANAVRTVLEASLALAGNMNAVTALEKMMMDLRRSEAVQV